LMILVITLIGIANSVLISVWEKRRLVGTLRAIGYSDRSILCLFIFEGAWIALIGAALGAFISALINIPLSFIGFDVLTLLKIGSKTIDVGFYIPPIIRTAWDLKIFLFPIIVTPIAAMLVSIFPAYKSIKMTIIECIRNND
ncbi:MAG: ABC transporter permease, partial [Brevinema sp.]